MIFVRGNQPFDYKRQSLVCMVYSLALSSKKTNLFSEKFSHFYKMLK